MKSILRHNHKILGYVYHQLALLGCILVLIFANASKTQNPSAINPVFTTEIGILLEYLVAILAVLIVADAIYANILSLIRKRKRRLT